MIHTQWCLSQLHKVASQLFAGISSDQRRLLLLKGTLLHLAVTQKGKNRGTPFHILKPKLYISSKDTQRQIWSYDSIQYIHVGKIYIYIWLLEGADGPLQTWYLWVKAILQIADHPLHALSNPNSLHTQERLSNSADDPLQILHLCVLNSFILMFCSLQVALDEFLCFCKSCRHKKPKKWDTPL